MVFFLLSAFVLIGSGQSEMVDFGSGQGRSEVETGGVAALRRGFQPNENAGLGQKMPFLVDHQAAMP
jgi:hypothetical protein